MNGSKEIENYKKKTFNIFRFLINSFNSLFDLILQIPLSSLFGPNIFPS